MTSSFDWLRAELNEIRTPGFHVVDGPAADGLREAIEKSQLRLSASYREFVLDFGNAKLYRRRSIHQLYVFASPTECESRSGQGVFQVGQHVTAGIYLEEVRTGSEAAVFETGAAGLRKVAESFSGWLQSAAAKARKSYTRAEWRGVVEGPAPFSALELERIRARSCFRWKVVGTSPANELVFEVTNDSGTVLPYLSVGIRSRDGKVQGGAYLPVASIQPGSTAQVRKDCYSRMIRPEDVEVFVLPDPRPEQRDEYWEFRGLDEDSTQSTGTKQRK